MARVTVEDCVTRVPNRFELVLLATQRSRQLSGGAELTVERENDRNPVIALREIADETVVVDDLRQSLITSLQKRVEIEGPEDDGMEILAAAGKEWAEVSGGDSIGTEPTGKSTAAAQAETAAAQAETDAEPIPTAKTAAEAETDAEPIPTAETAAEAEDDRPDTGEAEPAEPAETADESGEEKSEPSEP